MARSTPRLQTAPRTVRGILVKIALLAIVDAVAVYALFVLFLQREWLVFAIAAAVLVGINVVYLRRDLLPAKYLLPGVLFLAVFQIFVVVYSGYIAFTNYGDGHNSTKEDAIEAIVLISQQRVPDSPAYRLTILDQLGIPSFLVTDPDGDVFVGGEDRPLERVDDYGTDRGESAGVHLHRCSFLVRGPVAVLCRSAGPVVRCDCKRFHL